MSRRFFWPLAFVAALAVYLIVSSLYVVSEGQQALVVRLGAPVGVEASPGLHLHLPPPIDQIYLYDTRLLLLEPPTEQVILGDQKRLEVQPYARWRIVDPLAFYRALRTIEQARPQLSQFVSSSLRRELGQAPLSLLLTAERADLMERVRKEVAAKSAPLGVAIDEVRFHRTDLPFETSQAIYDRMKSERQREAKELRAQGYEWALEIEARADRERTVTLSEAQKAATISRGEGDADASRKLSEAFGANPKFYAFYRAIQTYKKSLAESGATLLLSPDADFLKLLTTGPDAALGPDFKPK